LGRFVRGRIGWAWPVASLLIVAASLTPFLLVDVPAVLDYPNHLARFFILAHPDDPILSRMYAPHWSIVPNVGMDVLGQALLRILPPHVGGRIVLALSLLAPMIGVVVYARAAFGRWTWWSLSVGVIAFNGIFFLGFMNFELGLGVALVGAGIWQVLRRHGRPWAAAAMGAATALCAFFCHILGYGLFALMVTAQEADPLLRAWNELRFSARRVLEAAALLSVALAPTALLYLFTHHPVVGGDIVAWLWDRKLAAWLTPFMSFDMRLTILTTCAVLGVAILTWRRAERATGVALALSVLAVLFVAAPFAAGGGTMLDTRFPLMAALVFFAGTSPRLSRRSGLLIATAFGLLVAARSALVGVNWLGRAHDLADLRGELAAVRPGATILAVVTDAPGYDHTLRGRSLPYFARLDLHLAALGLIERQCFWPGLFADPSQQPVVVRPPYAEISDPSSSLAEWPDLFSDPPHAAERSADPYLAHWRTRFDYVLLIGPIAQRLPAGLTLMRAGGDVSLFRVDH
jgi:hypothetical protein